ncbi:glycosyltransferase family 1 protein [Maritimibacter alkaliphilus]|uniref:glycosyltransferase family 4 protein n=1 Tax=Maritimibacter alkaliphilus TaxID=404236 RepID=UPI0028F6D924|nr:glycosyltransferase family 1 protein [Maritimibacter alkaliphilus]
MDRVERAYLSHLLTLDTPVYGLAKVAGGYVLLDRAGLSAFLDRVDGHAPWGRRDPVARLSRRLDLWQGRAQSDLRRLAIARAPRIALGWLMRRLPNGLVYLNTGHSALSARVISAVRRKQGRVSVLLHDTIPLDYPQFQRPGTVARFHRMLKLAGNGADLLIYNSAATQAAVERHLTPMGRIPPGVVAHLGLDLAIPRAGDLPEGLPPAQPYFVALGTVEPRKNHALLLEIWQKMPREGARLLICGARGWRNEETFATLDRMKAEGAAVEEWPGLSDGAVGALLEGARGLVFPSLAEGFGLPLIEAAALGCPIFCCDLPVTREVLGDIPVYLPMDDVYSWVKELENVAETPRAAPVFTPPTWQDHFKIVLKMT